VCGCVPDEEETRDFIVHCFSDGEVNIIELALKGDGIPVLNSTRS
jgi:hypothetical protein